MTAAHMKQFPWYLWLIFVLLIVSVVSFLVFAFIGYARAGVIWYYVGVVILLPIYIIVITCLFSNTRDLHIHHYSIGMVILCFFGYQSWWVSFISGLSNGIMIEGGSRWGYDSTW